MEKMGLNQLRESFLKFFEGKGHLILPSFSLIPESDKSLLLINSGMAPLKPYFTGQETPPRKRDATCQKCIRTPDIERVGKTARHGTFFEMLGNFSFGDYFKKEAIEWGWEYVTQVLKLPLDRLWVTIYHEDDEAFEIWTKDIGLDSDRVVRMGKEDNFWEIGVGPCGPSSEIFFDRGPEHGCGHEDCAIGCDCDRYVEFWNLVFTQFNKDEDGNYHPLEHPSIDTGMGLERIAAIMQGVNTLFEVDTIKNIMAEISKISGVEYGDKESTDISLRVITDHIRGTVFMISDGILPSNEGRGYVLRRILRRAARHGKLLGIKDIFLTQIAKVVIRESKEAYPELKDKEEYIVKIIEIEEKRFDETIDQGLDILKDYIHDLKKESSKVLDGQKAFRLYDTYGFPLDLTKEILEEEGLSVDEDGFNEQMKIQRERARAARQETDYMGADDPTYKLINANDVTEFKGYETLETRSRILNIIKDNQKVQSAYEGDQVLLVLDQTPFYAESGGQVGDRGVVESDTAKVEIEDVSKVFGSHIIHKGKVVSGEISINDEVEAKVDKNARMATARNHSTTHLLHKALKAVLGPHVEQAGSLVTPTRLRFDFSHFAPLTSEEIERIEEIVNEKIMEGLPVETIETTYDEAKKLGAIALFGEKYGDVVRVVKMGDFSTELCGGTHLSNTGQAGLFKIISETGIAAGVRRIEAVTGFGAHQWLKELNELLHNVSDTLKTNPNGLVQKAEGLVQQVKEYEQEIQQLKRQIAQGTIEELVNSKQSVGDVNYITAKIDNQDMNSLREIADILRNKLKSGVVVLASENQQKVNLVAAATKDLVNRGVHSGNLIREIAKETGGGGGGRPDMAQAGGKDPSKISQALEKVKVLLEQQLGMNK
ncbi:MAG: alanine--tRNA ligase [Clostridiales bacterium]|nr:alanine--tRNA ligase [Clostridiales bacterium]